MTEDTCSIGDGRPLYVRGWCSLHYMRWYIHGDPLTTKRILGDDQTRFESKVDRSGGPDACHLWLAARDVGGYGYFWISGRMRAAHLVAWEFTNGPTAPGEELDHECHNSAVREGTCSPGMCQHRLCCNVRHLMPKTRQQHIASTKRIAPRGSAHGRAKLVEQQVVEIRAALAMGETGASVARRYGLGESTIGAIKRRQTWT